jgi:hypothetical protein
VIITTGWPVELPFNKDATACQGKFVYDPTTFSLTGHRILIRSDLTGQPVGGSDDHLTEPVVYPILIQHRRGFDELQK